ncbi:hypothetical protein ACHQM5_013888 [Ranunculus cassubicifolius]
MMISLRLVSQRHSQLPPESFRLARLESLCCLILPWIKKYVRLYSFSSFQFFMTLMTIGT